MRLTLHTDYVLRVLLYAGLKQDEELATIAEIAGRFGIPRGPLMKAVHRLGQKGYLETTRGNRGGLRLAQPAAAIRVGDVVRDMEEELAVLGCLGGAASYCRIEECCALRGALREATNAFLAVLDDYTIADLSTPREGLTRLLAIAETGMVTPARAPARPEARHSGNRRGSRSQPAPKPAP